MRASKVLDGPGSTRVEAYASGDRTEFIEQVRQALYASKICSYAQGFVQMQAAATEHDWPLNFGDCALLWRGGCIIRAAVPRTDQGGVRRRSEPGEPAARPVLHARR